jgi:hypothetical protein
MLAPANAPPVGAERSGGPQWLQAVGKSAHDRCDIAKFDKPGNEQGAFPPYNHRATVVVGCAWLAFYIIAFFC